MVELVYTSVLETDAIGVLGSSPSRVTLWQYGGTGIHNRFKTCTIKGSTPFTATHAPMTELGYVSGLNPEF